MKKCPFCGKAHQDEKTVICTVCGTNMDEPSKAEKPSVKKGSLSKEKKLWAIIIMLIVTLFLAVAVTVVVMNIINDNETAEEVTVDEDQEQEDEEEEAPSDEPEEEPEEDPNDESPIDEPEEDQNKEDSSVDSDCTIVNCHQSITLRKTPNITAEEVTQVPFGADVEYVRYSRNGFCEILNSRPTNIADCADDISAEGAYFYFTTEEKSDVSQILKDFEVQKITSAKYTRGLSKNGVL